MSAQGGRECLPRGCLFRGCLPRAGVCPGLVSAQGVSAQGVSAWGCLPRVVSVYPPVNRITDRCENITLP